MKPDPLPAQTIISTGTARAPGTCGELVQGQFAGGQDFLVTLPINLYAEVQVEITHEPGIVNVTPTHKVKTRAAVRKTLAHCSLDQTGAMVRVTSELPEGKGMASSSADIVAACRATAQALNTSLSAAEISRIAHSIEPTDGVMYASCVCYDHRQCCLIEQLGPLSPLRILVIDLGGVIDTLTFNTQPKRYTADELDAIAHAYALVKAGIHAGDPFLIGRAATLSARINQRLLPKPQLDDVIAIAEDCGAYGVNVAHSGTILGMLFASPKPAALDRAQAVLTARFGTALQMFIVQTLNESETP